MNRWDQLRTVKDSNPIFGDIFKRESDGSCLVVLRDDTGYWANSEETRKYIERNATGNDLHFDYADGHSFKYIRNICKPLWEDV